MMVVRLPVAVNILWRVIFFKKELMFAMKYFELKGIIAVTSQIYLKVGEHF
jgi:hypothetical protein